MFIDKGDYLVIEDLDEKGIGSIYTDKVFGDVKKELFLSEERFENQKKFLKRFGLEGKKLIYGSQTHSNNIVDIRKIEEKIPYPDTDGFITRRRDIVIFTQYADCLPIYFYSEEKGVIGLCHSGWPGSYKEIGVRVVELMIKNYGCLVEEIKVYMGIGIKPCCYEVGDEFYEKFREKFPEYFIEYSFYRKDNRWKFDNAKFNEMLLKGVGIKNIEIDERCTYCDKRFHSYRRQGKDAGRNGAFIYFKD